MIEFGACRGRWRVSLVVGASLAAIGAGLATPALAQCAPDPTRAGTTTTCSGVDPDGVQITTSDSPVVVSTGAQVNGPITFDVASEAPATGTIAVDGAVNGGAQGGITIYSVGTGFGSAQVDVTVAADASVTGNNAIYIGPNPVGYAFGRALASIDNAGTLTGSSGTALAIGVSNNVGFQRITNRATGTIGGIIGSIGTLDNAGTIDGGTGSAIDERGSTGGIQAGLWTNSGVITSASSGGTITGVAQGTPAIVNTGTISNSGAGAALTGDFVSIDNQAGGVITAGSNGTAISSNIQLVLTNAGTINGNVIAATPSNYGFIDSVDSSLGTINGNVTFSNGGIIGARYGGTSTLVTGITGTIDGGTGPLTVQLQSNTDTVINTPLILQTAYQTLQLTPAAGTTVTLDNGFVAPGTIEVTGTGSLVNKADLTGSGTIIAAEVNTGPVAAIANLGSITSSGAVAVDLTQVAMFRNSGTITALNGTAVALSTGGSFVNTGTVVASGSAVSSFDTEVNNQGLIRSTGGIGLIAEGDSDRVSSNSGRIEGATYGALTNIALTNSGTISGGQAGVAMDAYGSFYNTADGVVTGPQSISTSGSNGTINATVANAGTLNGDVVLAGAGFDENNRYLALLGGVLNGNLVLGFNGTLVTDLVNTGPGQFAGITGTVSVSGDNSSLRYRVASDATVTDVSPVDSFSTVGYEIGTGATLTIAPTTPLTQTVTLAGTGNVVLTGDILTQTSPAVSTTPVVSLLGYDPSANSALSITNRGTIGLSRASNDTSILTAVALNYSDSFTNSGTVSIVSGSAGLNSYAIAGSASASVVNNGAIQLDGGTGVVGVGSLVNTGTITQVSGGDTAVGVVGVGTIDNRGTIRVGGAAIQSYGGTVRNSGAIVSTAGVAITNPDGTYLATTLDNAAGGTISGGAGTAVQLAGGTVTNAGTINGTVDLGYAAADYRSALPSTYTAAGGTIDGDLLFGDGDDVFVQTGTSSGVSGVSGLIDGGAGNNSMDVSGGSAAMPVAFGTIANMQAYRQSAGFATIAGQADLGAIALSGGRLVGLAGSTISAPVITVGQAATFGSAGTVNGNIAVAGTLRPGASPGTMTVNGNVTLASGSTSLFEITPTVSDTLVINGGLAIANGATLQLVPTGAGKPGTITDLIVASDGITGSYTNIVKPASLFGFLVQDGTSIRLFSEFLNDASFSPQVQRAIDYVNNVLVSGQSSAALLAAAPTLVTASGVSNPALFAELTPEPYASAQQIVIGDGLTLAGVGRSADFASHRDTSGLFTFASTLGGVSTLNANAALGTARAHTTGYGFLGGLGFGDDTWSLGAFAGYLNDSQTLSGSTARTKTDGAIVGFHGRFSSGGLGIKATFAYDDDDAHTRRPVPDGSVSADFHINGWTADAVIDYAVPVTGNWTVRPSVGATAIRTTRSATTEVGDSAFVLSVARRAETSVFVDGGVTFRGSVPVAGSRITPYLSLGVRYQAQGRNPIAFAGLGNGNATLMAEGAPRAPVVAVASLGAEMALSSRLTLFGAVSGESGDADNHASGHMGLRLAF